jgi:hypothetical protein
MTTINRTFFIIAVMLISAGKAHAQNVSTKLHDLYFQSIAYPENFDTSFELLEASGALKNEARPCLIYLKDGYFQLGQAAIKHCENTHGGDTASVWECKKNDPNASMFIWARDMVQVLDGNVKWTDTLMGSNMLTAKSTLELFQPGLWAQGVQWGMPALRQMIVCP